MKPSLTYLKPSLLGFVCAVLLLASATASKAQILLTVDVTHPDNIIITATGLTSSSPSTSDDFAFGVDLAGLFTSNPVDFTQFTVTSTSLTLSNGSGTQTFTETAGDNLAGVADGDNVLNLNLFHNAVPDTMDFTNNAFNGSMTVDLTTAFGGGSTGITDADISRAGGSIISIQSGDVVGSYDVVVSPEPKTWAELVAGIAFLAVIGRRLRRA